MKSSICSGGMNGTVPRISPEKVRPERPRPRKLLARPKSEILAIRPSGVAADQDVLGLDVAVDEPERVGLLQPLEHLAGHPAGLVDRVAAGLGLGQGLQVRARDVLHREPELAAGHPLLEPLDDVRVLQLADDRHLAEEAVDRPTGPRRVSGTISFSATICPVWLCRAW